MAFDRTFAAAYIDNGIRHKVLGRRLRPFCLWHLLLMQVLDSPFIRNGSVTLFDLKTVVAICSLKYRKSKLRRPIFPLILKLDELEKSVEAFMLYVGDYLSKPDYDIVPFDVHNPPKPGPYINPPPNVIGTVFHAAHGARIPVSEAWNMPIGEAYIAESMYFSMDGNQVDFFDDEERKFQEEMKEAGIK